MSLKLISMKLQTKQSPQTFFSFWLWVGITVKFPPLTVSLICRSKSNTFMLFCLISFDKLFNDWRNIFILLRPVPPPTLKTAVAIKSEQVKLHWNLPQSGSYHVWGRRGATCSAARSGRVRVSGPPAGLVWPAHPPASSDTALCFWSSTASRSASLSPWRSGTGRKEEEAWAEVRCDLCVCCSSGGLTCSCGVSTASNSRLRMSWQFFRADGALSWWQLRHCSASWAPSRVWNLSTIWLARR